MVAGLPQTLRVTSGNWRSEELLPSDFEVVRFSVDDTPLASATMPRLETRMVETEEGPVPVVVPLWEVTYVPPKTAAGTSAVIRAAAVDGSGADVVVEALPVRIAPDSAPFITLRQPVGPRADATVGVPLSVSGSLECADSCWIAELRKKKGDTLLVKLRCDCEKLLVTSAEDTKKETVYRATCEGFDTEEKLARVAAEVRSIQASRKKEPAKK